uniref:L-serine deaminase n=1 Tax=Magallana gigas TaxID=29159 RepID=K1QWD3_MAGGI
MANLPQEVKSGKRKLITMSAGNYGKAFAYTLDKLNLSGLCLMPLTAPSSRVALIKSLGVSVEQCPTSELTSEVNRYVQKENFIYYHSFDDARLVAGYGRDERKITAWSYGCEVAIYPSHEIQAAFSQYAAHNFPVLDPIDDASYITGCASVAMEILEDDVRPDVVVVCCGGGGLVSGIAAAIKLSGLRDCRIYAVEPEGSRTMYESFQKGEPVTMAVNSVATGLSPPYAGKLTYQCCRRYVEDVILVSDNEILKCMSRLFDIGLVAEPSGCAALAAILNNKIPDVAGKRVVAVVTGRIVTESILGPTTNVTSTSGFADTFSVPLSDNYSDPFAVSNNGKTTTSIIELQEASCDEYMFDTTARSFYMNNTCVREKPSSSTPSLGVNQVASLPLLISSVVAALVMVVFIILFFAKKCKRREFCRRKNTAMKNSAVNSGFGTQEGSEIGLLPVNDTYNELREHEKRTNDDGNQENYHHFDLTFVKDEVDPSQYDHVTKTSGPYEFVISHG